MRVAFVPRERPLSAVGAAGVGAAARRLGERLLAEDDGRLAALRGAASDDVLVILGEPESLPWVDGIAYLGVDPSAPRLLLPTAVRPDVPIDLFQRAVLSRAGESEAPIAVLVHPRRLVPTGAALQIERARLEAWVSRWA